MLMTVCRTREGKKYHSLEFIRKLKRINGQFANQLGGYYVMGEGLRFDGMFDRTVTADMIPVPNYTTRTTPIEEHPSSKAELGKSSVELHLQLKIPDDVYEYVGTSLKEKLSHRAAKYKELEKFEKEKTDLFENLNQTSKQKPNNHSVDKSSQNYSKGSENELFGGLDRLRPITNTNSNWHVTSGDLIYAPVIHEYYDKYGKHTYDNVIDDPNNTITQQMKTADDDERVNQTNSAHDEFPVADEINQSLLTKEIGDTAKENVELRDEICVPLNETEVDIRNVTMLQDLFGKQEERVKTQLSELQNEVKKMRASLIAPPPAQIDGTNELVQTAKNTAVEQKELNRPTTDTCREMKHEQDRDILKANEDSLEASKKIVEAENKRLEKLKEELNGEISKVVADRTNLEFEKKTIEMKKVSLASSDECNKIDTERLKEGKLKLAKLKSEQQRLEEEFEEMNKMRELEFEKKAREIDAKFWKKEMQCKKEEHEIKTKEVELQMKSQAIDTEANGFKKKWDDVNAREMEFKKKSHEMSSKEMDFKKKDLEIEAKENDLKQQQIQFENDKREFEKMKDLMVPTPLKPVAKKSVSFASMVPNDSESDDLKTYGSDEEDVVSDVQLDDEFDNIYEIPKKEKESLNKDCKIQNPGEKLSKQEERKRKEKSLLYAEYEPIKPNEKQKAEEEQKLKEKQKAEEEQNFKEKQKAEEEQKLKENQKAEEEQKLKEKQKAEEEEKLKEKQKAEEEQKLKEKQKAEEEQKLKEKQKAEEEWKLKEKQKAEEEQKLKEKQKAKEELKLKEKQKAEEEQKLKEKQKAEEEQKLKEKQKVEEEQKLKEKQKAEEELKLKEKQKAEEEQKLKEKQKAEEEQKLKEKQKAEEEQKLKEKQKAEEELKLKEKQKAEEEQKLKEKQKAEEEQKLKEKQKAEEEEKLKEKQKAEEEQKLKEKKKQEMQILKEIQEQEEKDIAEAERKKVEEEKRKADERRRLIDEEVRRKIEERVKKEEAKKLASEKQEAEKEKRKQEEDQRKWETETRKKQDASKQRREEMKQQAEQEKKEIERKRLEKLRRKNQEVKEEEQRRRQLALREEMRRADEERERQVQLRKQEEKRIQEEEGKKLRELERERALELYEEEAMEEENERTKEVEAEKINEEIAQLSKQGKISDPALKDFGVPRKAAFKPGPLKFFPEEDKRIEKNPIFKDVPRKPAFAPGPLIDFIEESKPNDNVAGLLSKGRNTEIAPMSSAGLTPLGLNPNPDNISALMAKGKNTSIEPTGTCGTTTFIKKKNKNKFPFDGGSKSQRNTSHLDGSVFQNKSNTRMHQSPSGGGIQPKMSTYGNVNPTKFGPLQTTPQMASDSYVDDDLLESEESGEGIELGLPRPGQNPERIGLGLPHPGQRSQRLGVQHKSATPGKIGLEMPSSAPSEEKSRTITVGKNQFRLTNPKGNTSPRAFGAVGGVQRGKSAPGPGTNVGLRPQTKLLNRRGQKVEKEPEKPKRLNPEDLPPGIVTYAQLHPNVQKQIIIGKNPREQLRLMHEETYNAENPLNIKPEIEEPKERPLQYEELSLVEQEDRLKACMEVMLGEEFYDSNNARKDEIVEEMSQSAGIPKSFLLAEYRATMAEVRRAQAREQTWAVGTNKMSLPNMNRSYHNRNESDSPRSIEHNDDSTTSQRSAGPMFVKPTLNVPEPITLMQYRIMSANNPHLNKRELLKVTKALGRDYVADEINQSKTTQSLNNNTKEKTKETKPSKTIKQGFKKIGKSIKKKLENIVNSVKRAIGQ